MCLCRRHHRVKQSPGWSVRLARDGTATWADPAGRTRTTFALDALDALVLGPGAGRSGALRTGDRTAPNDTDVADDRGGTTHPDDVHDATCGGATQDVTHGPDAAETVAAAPAPPWSALETHVELLLEHRPPHRRCTTASALRAALPRHRVLGGAHGPPPF